LASLYLDHNVARGVATALRLAGHNVCTAREIHTDSAGDDEHVALAYQNGWIFVTHNTRHFALPLHDAWRRWSRLWGLNVPHPGILTLRPGPAEQIATLVDERLGSGAPIAGELAVWRSRDGWRQRL
jgi:hypothetical protein